MPVAVGDDAVARSELSARQAQGRCEHVRRSDAQRPGPFVEFADVRAAQCDHDIVAAVTRLLRDPPVGDQPGADAVLFYDGVWSLSGKLNGLTGGAPPDGILPVRG